jgi:hypothetical protein
MKKSIDRRLSKRQGTHRSESRGGRAAARTPRTVVLVLIGVAAGVVGGILVWRMNRSGDAPSTPSGAVARREAPASAALPKPRATVSGNADFRALVGRWVRLDSPYVIEIRSAGDDGTLEAAYYNPRSINVSRAEAREKNGKLEVFVELRDINYPGSNYRLTYDRATDLLRGVYFQAVMQQNFDVAFRRLKPR